MTLPRFICSSIAAAALALVPFVAGACPPGSILQKGNGWEGCIEQPRSSEPLWADRWGAIATDQLSGAFGSSSAETSKRNAEKYALSMCRKNGGKQKAVYSSCSLQERIQ